jgi:phage baseplate assembly protein W
MEFYVRSLGDPGYSSDKMQQDDDLSMLLTQIETILFTRRGSVLGSPDFGANLEDYVYELRYNDYLIKKVVNEQLNKYVPLSKKYPVTIDVELVEEMNRHVMFLDIRVDSKFQLGVYI